MIKRAAVILLLISATAIGALQDRDIFPVSDRIFHRPFRDPYIGYPTGSAGSGSLLYWDGSAWIGTDLTELKWESNILTVTDVTVTGLSADQMIIVSAGGALSSQGAAANGQIPIGSVGAAPVLAAITGTTDHISVTNAAGSITLDLDTNTRTLLGSFNGIFLERLNFTVSEAAGTVTGTLEKDGGGDLTQKFSDGYTILDTTPALTINLTAFVGTDAVPATVFVYILQSAKTVMAASNSDWPSTEHGKIAKLILKSAVTTGTDGGALGNQNWNDYAVAESGEGHILHVESRLRQEPAQYDTGIALTLKDAGGAALTTGNSSTAVEIVLAEGKVYQLHRHTFPAFDMFATATDDVHVTNQPTDQGGAYETTADLVTDITHYVDGTSAGVAIGVNKYFNLIVWGVMNRQGEPSHVMINLPTGQYNNSADAISDIDGTSVFDIPSQFKGIGFLIARLSMRLIAGSQWTYVALEDLRGQAPSTTAGVGVSTSAHDLLANLDFASAGHTGFQAQGDVLDDLNTLGAAAADNEVLIGTGVGVLAWESGATLSTSLGLTIGSDIQAWDSGLDNLAALTYASDSFIKVTATDVYAVRTLAQTKQDLSLDNVENTALTTWPGTANITTLGTISSGVWEATDVAILHGGTGQSTAQTAIDALSAVSAATNEHVLTKDTGTGNAIWKVAAGGSADDTPYDATSWNANLDAATKNVLRDKIETIDTAIGLNTTHRSSDGSDHSFLDQAVTIVATPTFGGIIMANNATIGQSGGPLLTFNDTQNFLGISGCWVGMGIVNPQQQLDVRSQAATQGDSRFSVLLRDTTPFAAGVGTGIAMGGVINTGGASTTFGSIWVEKENSTDGDTRGQLHLGTRPVAGGLISSDLVINSSGGVLMLNLKSGTTQGGAGAAVDELWVDTDDDNTVKRGV